jgi:hypothetical protein
MATPHADLYSRLRTLLGDNGEVPGFSNAQLDDALVLAVEEADANDHTSVSYSSDGTNISPTLASLADKLIVLYWALMEMIGPVQDALYMKTGPIVSWRQQGMAGRAAWAKRQLDKLTGEHVVAVSTETEFNEWLDADQWVDDKVEEDT